MSGKKSFPTNYDRSNCRPVKSHKRTGSMGLLGPTECQVNTNVTVFRESQQRNYLFLDQPQLVDVFSVSPLPKVLI